MCCTAFPPASCTITAEPGPDNYLISWTPPSSSLNFGYVIFINGVATYNITDPLTLSFVANVPGAPAYSTTYIQVATVGSETPYILSRATDCPGNPASLLHFHLVSLLSPLLPICTALLPLLYCSLLFRCYDMNDTSRFSKCMHQCLKTTIFSCVCKFLDPQQLRHRLHLQHLSHQQ